MKWDTVAEFSFILGVILAVFLGTFGVASEGTYAMLMVLGCVVGLVNIFDREIQKFSQAIMMMLVSTLAFYALAAVSQNPMLMMFEHLSASVSLFIAPVAFILSAKDIYNIAMNYRKGKEQAAPRARKRKR